MTVGTDTLEKIRSNADFVIDEFGPISDLDFGFDAASVKWIEGYIERQRRRECSDEMRERLINALGCFLGEAIIRETGGEWSEDGEGRLGVKFANGDMCFPLYKVEKQFVEGADAGESIAGFYNVSVNYIAKGRLHAAPAERP